MSLSSLTKISIQENFKVDARNEFHYDIFILSTMPWLYICWKNYLHVTYKRFDTDEKRLANIPENVTPATWTALINYFSSD